MYQFRLVFHKRQHPTYIVGDAKRQQSDDKDQEQHPPEAQILYKLLPCGAEAGQDPLTLLQTPLCSRVATGISWSSLGGLKRVKPPEAFGEQSPSGHVGETKGMRQELWAKVWIRCVVTSQSE